VPVIRCSCLLFSAIFKLYHESETSAHQQQFTATYLIPFFYVPAKTRYRGENIHLAFVKFELLQALQVHTERDAVGNFGSSLFHQGQSHLTLPASHPLGPQ